MKEIRIIKTFYIWRNTGKIDDKWIVYGVKDNGEHTVKNTIIQKENEMRLVVEVLKKQHEGAKVRLLDKQKYEKIKHKYKVLSEDLKEKINA